MLIRLCGLCLIAAVVALTIIYWRPHAATASGPPRWNVSTVHANGHQAILARLAATDGRNWAGKRYELVLRCKDQKTPDAYVDWATQISTGSPPVVSWRLDSGQTHSERWITSLDGGTTFAHDPRAFIDALRTHKQLRLQVLDQQGKSHVAEFDMDDGDRALAPLRADCGLR